MSDSVRPHRRQPTRLPCPWDSSGKNTGVQRTDSFEKPLMLGKIEGGRRRGRQRMRQLDGITDSVDMSFSTRVRSLGWEDTLEKGMATHSGTLAWRIPWTEEPGGLQSVGSQRVGHD